MNFFSNINASDPRNRTGRAIAIRHLFVDPTWIITGDPRNNFGEHLQDHPNLTHWVECGELGSMFNRRHYLYLVRKA